MKWSFLALLLFVFVAGPVVGHAQTTINLNAAAVEPSATMSVSPATESVTEGSTFNVSVYLNTERESVNTVSLDLRFSPDKLSIVSESTEGKSFIAVWVEPPTYSNSDGTVHLAGIVPNGIITQSGLVISITFKAIASGNATVEILPSSQVLANDGMGTPIPTEYSNGTYTISPAPPGGVTVTSVTDPFQDQWYNNNNVTLSWEKDPQVSDFSYTLDDKPFTVPANISEGSSTTVSYNNLADGVYYFHVKAEQQGVWGLTTNFAIHIDTTPPAAFTPTVDFATNGTNPIAFVNFFTTDNLSGIDHYEVGVVDVSGSSSTVASPVFTQADSPYQFETAAGEKFRVVVRAFDHAGNAEDGTVDVTVPFSFVIFAQNHFILILECFLLLALLILILHYLVGHHILRHLRLVMGMLRREDKLVEQEEEQREEEELKNLTDIPPSPPPPPSL